MEKISINVDGNEFNAEIENGEPEFLINDKSYTVKKLKQFAPNIYSFLVNNRMVLVELENNESEKQFFNACGFYHEVEITNDAKKLIRKYLKETGSALDSGNAQIKSPMPGMIVKLLVEQGATVKKGDKIIIIEAMKMENAIASPIDGIVSNIKVKEGEAVEKEALLLEIENNNNK